MDEDRLSELMSHFPSRRIAVVGDFFLDKYLEFDPSLAEVSLETGKTANQVVNICHSPGAAGNVASNLSALGAGYIADIGFTGDNGEGYELRQDLSALGCDMSRLLYSQDRYTPTYIKPRNILIPGLRGEEPRYDIKNREPLPYDIEKSIIEFLRSLVDSVDAMIVIDQADEANCGVITDGVRDAIIELAKGHSDVVFWADSRRRAGLFRNVILKPNQFEAVHAAFPEFDGDISDEIVVKAGMSLAEVNNAPVFLTRSEKGMMVFYGNDYEIIPGFSVDVDIDPTGAGDSVTAAAVLALASGASYKEAAIIANLAGSIVVRKLGVTGTASPEELMQAFRNG